LSGVRFGSRFRAGRFGALCINLVAGGFVLLTSPPAQAQDLAPRAYLITPVSSSAITLADSYSTGSVFTDPSVAIEDALARFHTQTISYYYSFDLLGRSANITALVPYALGTVRASIVDQDRKAYRSGLADSRIRFSMNIKGGPAMTADAFSSWREKGLIGVSFTAILPTGQYDSGRLVNIGNNRFAFKPEIGLSRRWNRLALEGYGSAWFFASNYTWFPGTSRRTQEPIGAGEAHLTYYVSRRMWASLDGNFWWGGRSTVNGQRNADIERNSRTGFTVAIPVSRRDSIKFSYATGTYVTIGGAYTTLSVAWQYSWIGKAD
jgi:hypothetical protein